MNIKVKILQKYQQTKPNNTCKGFHTMNQWDLSKFGLTFKSDIIYYINRIKNRNLMVLSTDMEKGFDKIHHLLMMKTINKQGTKGNFLNLRKSSVPG